MICRPTRTAKVYSAAVNIFSKFSKSFAQFLIASLVVTVIGCQVNKTEQRPIATPSLVSLQSGPFLIVGNYLDVSMNTGDISNIKELDGRIPHNFKVQSELRKSADDYILDYEWSFDDAANDEASPLGWVVWLAESSACQADPKTIGLNIPNSTEIFTGHFGEFRSVGKQSTPALKVGNLYCLFFLTPIITGEGPKRSKKNGFITVINYGRLLIDLRKVTL